MTAQDSVILTPVPASPTTFTAADYYDPKVSFSFKPSRNGSISVAVPKLVSDFRQNRSRRYTLPTVLSRISRSKKVRAANPNSGPVTGPCMWETVDRLRTDNDAWAMIIASPAGDRLGRTAIQSLRHATDLSQPASQFWSRGRHTLLRLDVGTLLGIISLSRGVETFMVLRVDALLPWPSAAEVQPDEQYPAGVANVSVVYVQEKDRMQNVECYASPDLDTRAAESGVKQMLDFSRELIYNKDSITRYARPFIEKLSGRVAELNRDMPESYLTQVVAPEDLVSQIHSNICAYRRVLKGVDHNCTSLPLPLNLHYTIIPGDTREGDLAGIDGVEIVVEIPSEVPDHPGVAIATTLNGTIPESLQAERRILFGAKTFDKLLELVSEQTEPRHIYTRF